MRIIKPATLTRYWAKHRDARAPLEQWLAAAHAADWRNLEHVRQTFPHADAAAVASGATVTIFNIKGNKYRLIVAIHYRNDGPGIIFIRDFLTHADYSKNTWKDRH